MTRAVPIDTEALFRLHRQGLSLKQLAEALNCGECAIRRNLRTLGLFQPKARKIAPVPSYVETTRVYRDPCTYCGVRGDIGCVHNREAA